MNKPPRDYGEADPLKDTYNFIQPCKCGCSITHSHIKFEKPQPWQLGLLRGTEIRSKRYFIECPECSARSKASKVRVTSIIQWNQSKYAVKPDYKIFPFFKVDTLPINEALVRLELIRADLKVRLEDCRLRKEDTDIANRPGPRFYAKLEVYQSWAYYMIHLIKLQLEGS